MHSEKLCLEQRGDYMPVIFGSARIDENGNLAGGKAGDQTGKEISIQPYYMHKKGWVVLRAKDKGVANVLCKAMQEACANDFIGYDQNQRTTVITELKKKGSFARIDTFCEADCSSLVRGCCIQAGFDPGNFTTANEASLLMATGKFMNFDVKSEAELQNGDILVTKTKGHTVIVVSSSNKVVETVQTTPTATVYLDKLESAKERNKDLSGQYLVNASSLNLRTGPTTKHKVLASLSRNTVCSMYGYYTRTEDTDWYLVVANGKTGFVSSKYLVKV